MKELYWITVLGNISTAVGILTLIAAILTIVSAVAYLLAICFNEDEDIRNNFLKCTKYTAVILIVIEVICIWIPSKEELLFIYGVGSTIDYVQSNEETKQLPDKAVKALNLWADDYLKDNKTNETAD